ncbi:hypothetical protein PLICRDRAFT_92481 [Plicaturopsis crispa FD-325 SS-3]|nr:hypothetical protein PLICRDRAFT_92481 [Plicaturopsis crispa FD-325 SS-3]
MHSSLLLALSVSLVPIVAAQNSTAPVDIQVEAIQAHFTNAGIVPSLLPTFSPTGVLDLAFTGVGDVSPGAALSQDQVKPTPNLSLLAANSSVSTDGNFTIVMADADVVGTDESKGQTRHWLVNGATVSGSNFSVGGGVAITAYAGPAPAPSSGAHRYVVMLYQQPSTFSPPANLSQAGVPVSTFSLADYVKTSNLGPLVAATYFTVEVGTASASASPTSAVVTSTLASSASSSTASSSSSEKTNGAMSIGPAFAMTPMFCIVVALVGIAAF